MSSRYLAVVVPTNARSIDPGSAVVCALNDDGSLVENDGLSTIYFESNRYGAVNLETFEQKVRCAGERLVSNYPTVAKSHVDVRELVVAGVYSVEARQLSLYDTELLESWGAKI